MSRVFKTDATFYYGIKEGDISCDSFYFALQHINNHHLLRNGGGRNTISQSQFQLSDLLHRCGNPENLVPIMLPGDAECS